MSAFTHPQSYFIVHSVFCCLSVYILGGFLYQRLVVGAKGVEQFPNFAFWSEIGNLSAVGVIMNAHLGFILFLKFTYTLFVSQQDGCDFVCRTRGSREEPPTYRGVATEPLEDEPEERDDHLLPM